MNFKFLYLTLFISANCFSQDIEEPQTVDIAKFNVNNPGFSYEKSIGKSQTFYGQAFMNTSVVLSKYYNSGLDMKFYLNPAATLQYRYYYDGAKRLAKGKKTDMNNMNYLTGVYELIYSKMRIQYSSTNGDKIRPIHTLGAAWGLQRNLKGRWSIDFNIGLGYQFASEKDYYDNKIKERSPTFISRLNFGYTLGKK